MLGAAAADDARRGEAVGRGGQRGDHAEAVRRLEHDLPPLAAAIGGDHDHRDVARPGWRRSRRPPRGVPLAATELRVALAAPAGGHAESRRQCWPSGEIQIDWPAPCEPTATKPAAVAATAFAVDAASRPSSPPLLSDVQLRRSAEYQRTAKVRPPIICLPTTT